MNIEDAYFNTLNEMAMLCQLYQTMSEEQIATTDETANSWFSELPPDLIERYKVFLRKSIEQEKARGAYARASALDNHALALGIEEDQE
ncbi:MAG TPA: hypothetical protein VHY22_12825 [Chthoniobacteraceae bacterium]|jgi:hypothetical protein|nr:hypothetical protein [Chthoniobacteraceae bacterium]